MCPIRPRSSAGFLPHLQFTRGIPGSDSFFNMGVTGADVDNMTSYYKMVTYGKAPKVLLWSIDPWVFYNSEAAYDSRADADLYNEFLTKVLWRADRLQGAGQG